MIYEIKLFAMGGTIDKVVLAGDKMNYTVGSPQAERILAGSNLTVKISIESVVKKDSLTLTDQDRAILKDKIISEQCNRIIITHGTDTIPDTARYLKDISEKTIVFTGAMLPARFFDSDATFNLGSAVIAAQTLPPGLYLTMHGKIMNPLKAVKNSSLAQYSE